MVDVTQHKIFPTIVSEFKYDIGSEEHSIVLKELRSSETKMILQTKDNLHTKLPLFKKKVFETCSLYPLNTNITTKTDSDRNTVKVP